MLLSPELDFGALEAETSEESVRQKAIQTRLPRRPGLTKVVGGVGGAIVNPPTTACGESVFEMVQLESCLALSARMAFTGRAHPAGQPALGPP